MTRAEIVQAVTRQVQQVIPGAADIDEDAEFLQFAGYDSLSFLEIVIWLETEFHVEVPDGELATAMFTTVGHIVDYVVQASEAGVR